MLVVTENLQQQLQQAKSYEQRGNWRDAFHCYTELQKIITGDPKLLNKLSELAFRLNHLDQAEEYIRQALSLSPRNSNFYNTLGIISAQQQKKMVAEQCYQEAVTINPENAAAWNNWGILKKQQQNFSSAIECFNKAITLNPQFQAAYTNLGSCLKVLDHPDDAVKYHLTAIELAPNNADAHYNLANAYYEIPEFDLAEKYFNQTLLIDKGHIGATLGKALMMLLTGNLHEGFKLFETRLKTNSILQPQQPLDIPIWYGENICGKQILITWEQGLGDRIQFVRYIPRLQDLGARVSLQCDSSLIELFRSLQGVDLVALNEIPEEVDYYCPIMSLPLRFNTNIETIPNQTPYLSITKEKQNRWQKFLSKQGIDNGSFKVGLVWCGNKVNQTDYKRSLQLAELQPLFQCARITFYSLQIDAEKDEWEKFGLDKENCLAEYIQDFTDTAAIIKNLDLVITVDTAIAHLAGALHCPVWVLLAKVNDWRWMLGLKTTPWYPSMRLFRQNTRGNWKYVIAQIKEELRELFCELPEV